MFEGKRRTRDRRFVAILGPLFIVTAIASCTYWRVWSYDDLRLYRHLRYHAPVAHELWYGKIRPGDRIEPVIARYRPNLVHKLGPFLRIEYYPKGDLSPGSISLEGTALTAIDGRLISAESYGCTYHRTYFDIFGAEEKILHNQLVQEMLTKAWRESEP